MNIFMTEIVRRLLKVNTFSFLADFVRRLFSPFTECLGFPGGSEGKESACNSGYLGSIPGSGRSPGEGNGY